MTERRKIDLNAAREARGATQKEPVELIVGYEADGKTPKTYELPSELPLDFVELIQADQVTAAFASLVGAEKAPELAHELRFEDAEALSELIAEVYGIEGGLGNLPASGAS